MTLHTLGISFVAGFFFVLGMAFFILLFCLSVLVTNWLKRYR